MNNLSHKVAATFVCTALGFVLGTNTEAKAATLTLSPNTTFGVQDFNHNQKMLWDGMGDVYASSGPVVKGTLGEIEFRVEFALFPQLLPSNTVISRAIVQTGIYLGIKIGSLTASIVTLNVLVSFPLILTLVVLVSLALQATEGRIFGLLGQENS